VKHREHSFQLPKQPYSCAAITPYISLLSKYTFVYDQFCSLIHAMPPKSTPSLDHPLRLAPRNPSGQLLNFAMPCRTCWQSSCRPPPPGETYPNPRSQSSHQGGRDGPLAARKSPRQAVARPRTRPGERHRGLPRSAKPPRHGRLGSPRGTRMGERASPRYDSSGPLLCCYPTLYGCPYGPPEFPPAPQLPPPPSLCRGELQVYVIPPSPRGRWKKGGRGGGASNRSLCKLNPRTPSSGPRGGRGAVQHHLYSFL